LRILGELDKDLLVQITLDGLISVYLADPSLAHQQETALFLGQGEHIARLLHLHRLVRIVPVVSIGGQETALFLGQGEHVARLLHLHRLLRIDVAPVQIAPPWGVTVLDLPGRLPLPAKISIDVLSPIDLREELGGARGDPDEGYELVTGRMQDALRKLAEARALPLIG